MKPVFIMKCVNCGRRNTIDNYNCAYCGVLLNNYE